MSVQQRHLRRRGPRLIGSRTLRKRRREESRRRRPGRRREAKKEEGLQAEELEENAAEESGTSDRHNPPTFTLPLTKWTDVDLAAGFLSVKTAKTGETVDIPIFPLLAEELARAKAKAGTSEFSFPDPALMYRSNPDGIT